MNPYGIRTRAQLIADGVQPGTIDSRCRSGRYHRVLPGTYSLGEPTKLARVFAVSRWQPLARISHRTAGWLHGWLDEPALVEATVPKRVKLRTPRWLRLYRRDLDPSAVSEEWGIPTVTREQALLDCIAVLPRDAADRLVDKQLGRAVGFEDMHLLAKTHPGRWGNHELNRQLRHAAVRALSEPERLLARAFHERGYDIDANDPVGPFYCDFVDRKARLIVEVDGREFHSEPDVFRRDRRRQNWLVCDGWMILRYAAADVLRDPFAVADEVIAIALRRRHARR